MSESNQPQNTSISNSSAESDDDLEHRGSSRSSKGERIKWTLLLISYIVEVLSSTFDELPEKPIYALMGMLLAYLGLIASIIELYYRVREQNNIMRSLFEDALENFGICASIWQWIYSIIEYICIKNNLDNPIKMPVLPLIFLIGVAISRLCSNYRGDQNSQQRSHSRGASESSVVASTLSGHGASVPVRNASDNEGTRELDRGDQISRQRSHSRGEPESSVDALTSSGQDASVFGSNANDNREAEWKEEDEPGVYLTIRKLVDGTNELVRISFSERKFREETAAVSWWEENRRRILLQYKCGDDGNVPLEFEGESESSMDALTSSRHGASGNEETEWKEEDEPGVYLTIRKLVDGTSELVQISFSKKKFREDTAESWWEENRKRIQLQYKCGEDGNVLLNFE